MLVLVRVSSAMSIGVEPATLNLKYELYAVGPLPPLQPTSGGVLRPTLKLKFFIGLLKESCMAAAEADPPTPQVRLITQRPSVVFVVTSLAGPRVAVLSFGVVVLLVKVLTVITIV